ncbi:hypothetical protein [Sphingomonas sp. CV7422]|uniref:hypothetical protein n=1 Tax=Sphingomonas sp. CV7422 TaxID=3018036 RepID=UPI0022FEF12F|nr:hypothetical protein [Sphingomonas sp. CV7422]
MSGSIRLGAPGVRPTVGDLRRVRDMLASAGDSSAASVAGALGIILRGGDAVTALGLKAATGRRSALTIDRIAARDDLLRRLASAHYQGMSTSGQAREIAKEANSYARRAAGLDVDLDDMPTSYLGRPREYLFHIARLPASVPSERTIRVILSV